MLLILVALAAAPTTALASVTAATAHTRTAARRRPPVTPPPPLPDFRERHGPRCIQADDISAAAVTGPAQVDFALRGGERVRAQLETECPALDFYRGFYLPPAADGKVCADRDTIRTRAGGDCVIDRFRKLETVAPAAPKPPKPKHQP